MLILPCEQISQHIHIVRLFLIKLRPFLIKNPISMKKSTKYVSYVHSLFFVCSKQNIELFVCFSSCLDLKYFYSLSYRLTVVQLLLLNTQQSIFTSIQTYLIHHIFVICGFNPYIFTI